MQFRENRSPQAKIAGCARLRWRIFSCGFGARRQMRMYAQIFSSARKKLMNSSRACERPDSRIAAGWMALVLERREDRRGNVVGRACPVFLLEERLPREKADEHVNVVTVATTCQRGKDDFEKFQPPIAHRTPRSKPPRDFSARIGPWFRGSWRIGSDRNIDGTVRERPH